MMSKTDQILIIDSTGNRRKELCELWSGVLGYEVMSFGGGDFLRFRNDGESEKIPANELSNIQPLACLLHAGDVDKYQNPEVKKLVDSSKRVVLFSGAGIPGTKSGWSANWFWIPRMIRGRDSASDIEWRQLGDWFKTSPSGPSDGRNIDLLSVRKRPQFLIAIYILCQGFLAAERMRERMPTAVDQTRNKTWWSVPLLKSAENKLVEVVKQEWGGDVPTSVLRLVEWVASKPGSESLDLATTVAEAKKELECRIAK